MPDPAETLQPTPERQQLIVNLQKQFGQPNTPGAWQQEKEIISKSPLAVERFRQNPNRVTALVFVSLEPEIAAGKLTMEEAEALAAEVIQLRQQSKLPIGADDPPADRAAVDVWGFVKACLIHLKTKPVEPSQTITPTDLQSAEQLIEIETVGENETKDFFEHEKGIIKTNRGWVYVHDFSIVSVGNNLDMLFIYNDSQSNVRENNGSIGISGSAWSLIYRNLEHGHISTSNDSKIIVINNQGTVYVSHRARAFVWQATPTSFINVEESSTYHQHQANGEVHFYINLREYSDKYPLTTSLFFDQGRQKISISTAKNMSPPDRKLDLHNFPVQNIIFTNQDVEITAQLKDISQSSLAKQINQMRFNYLTPLDQNIIPTADTPDTRLVTSGDGRKFVIKLAKNKAGKLAVAVFEEITVKFPGQYEEKTIMRAVDGRRLTDIEDLIKRLKTKTELDFRQVLKF